MSEETNVASEIEKLLGLPPNSTKNKKPETLLPHLTRKVVQKTSSLEDQAGDLMYLEQNVHSVDRLKANITIDNITQYRIEMISELEQVRMVSAGLLERYNIELNSQINVSERMYLVGPSIIDSLVKCITKIEEILQKIQKDNKEELVKKQQNDEKKTGIKQTAKGWAEMINEIDADDE